MMLSWIRNLKDSDGEYIIYLAETNEIIGECSLKPGRKSAEIGLLLLPQYWGLGYGTETVKILVEKANDLHLEKVSANSFEKTIGKSLLNLE